MNEPETSTETTAAPAPFVSAPVLKANEKPFENPVDTLRRMRQYSKCFTEAFDRGEKVFVLREQDATAWMAVAQWIHTNMPRLGANHPKIIAAKQTMVMMKETKRPTKLPD